MLLFNRTHLRTPLLDEMFHRGVEGWPHEPLRVHVRYSRGADFSGTCFYRKGLVTINLGRANNYPYLIRTGIARTQSDQRRWWRELYSVHAADAYRLALFVFMHEFYHWLVHLARRNVRQKEARCDRFAVRELVDRYGATVVNARGRTVGRDTWDFQDLDGFVAAARRRRRIQVESSAPGASAALATWPNTATAEPDPAVKARRGRRIGTCAAAENGDFAHRIEMVRFKKNLSRQG